jgi:hypothetical protein
MEKFIYRHLDKRYEVGTTEAGNDSIYLKSDTSRYRTPEKYSNVVESVTTVFAIENEEADLYIQVWATKKKSDVDLTFYKKTIESLFENVAFPIVRRVFAQTIAHDLVPVQPMSMSMPSGLLPYIDFTYGKKTRFERVKSYIINTSKNIYRKIIVYINKMKYICNEIYV